MLSLFSHACRIDTRSVQIWKRSYITVAKHLCIATRVSSIHKSVSNSGNACVVHSDDPHDQHQVFKQRNSMFVQLCSLALMPTTGRAQTIMRYSLPLSKPLIRMLCLPSKATSSYLPNLSISMIEKQCRVSGQQAKYRLEDATNLLLEMCGSYEEYQTCILKKTGKGYSGDCIILEIFESLLQASWACKMLWNRFKKRSRIALIPKMWESDTNTSSAHYYSVELQLIRLYKKSRKVTVTSAMMFLATHTWIEFTEQLAEHHSVLKLFIKGSPRLSQLEDYFVAVMAYDELWYSLPQSIRPSRDVLYRDLGIYLLSTLPRSQCEMKLTKEELLNAMERCGKMIVDSSTREVCCSARSSCCILM